MNFPSNSPLDTGAEDAGTATRAALADLGTAARGGVVNRTHRVLRQRAKVLQARRIRVRGLMFPLVLCSFLLLLTVAAMWSGLYQDQAVEAAEAVQADVAALGASEASNHLLVALLWFVPVSIAVLGTLLSRRSRSGSDRETVR